MGHALRAFLTARLRHIRESAGVTVRLAETWQSRGWRRVAGTGSAREAVGQQDAHRARAAHGPPVAEHAGMRDRIAGPERP